MRHLAAGVHAGIGAPGALHRHRLAAEGLERGGEHPLHGQARGLHLPAGKGGAVIFNFKHIPGHD